MSKPTQRKLAASFEYLDVLRESGVTNMFGAASYLMRDLGRSRDEAVSHLSLWMKTFSAAPVQDRARAAVVASRPTP